MAEGITHALRGNSGIVNILITEEQSQNPEFKKRSSQWHIGFLPPEKVPYYACFKCKEQYFHPPKIEVHIFTMFEDLTNTMVAYRCSECGELIHGEYLKSPKGINKKYITFDETGDWKTPTIEDIEAQLSKAEDSAKRGEGNSLSEMRYKDFVKRALHWSGKISYKIPEERLKKLETTYRDSYLKRMEKELPEWVEDIKSRGYGFSGDLTEGMSTFEYTGLSDMLPKLYEVLPLINLPEDTGLKQDILRILFAHMKMHEDSVSALKVGLEEEKKKIDEEIASEREELKIVTNHMKKFRRRSGLKRRQVRRLKRDPINTDY